jgi:hypothetical protein
LDCGRKAKEKSEVSRNVNRIGAVQTTKSLLVDMAKHDETSPAGA